LHAAFQEAAEGKLKGILALNREPTVSMDYKGDDRSSIVDADFTQVLGGNMVKVVAWYDNEWAYSVRVADLAVLMAKSL
jgi:glyceraldehyde-3-phosphate dehydrogenase/erythrose-4-phosphate dehydrogenase